MLHHLSLRTQHSRARVPRQRRNDTEFHIVNKQFHLHVYSEFVSGFSGLRREDTFGVAYVTF